MKNTTKNENDTGEAGYQEVDKNLKAEFSSEFWLGSLCESNLLYSPFGHTKEFFWPHTQF